MISRSYLSAIALSALGWAAFAIAFIWIIDPYGTSPIKVSLPGFNALKPSRHNIDRIIKPQEVLARQPRTVFLGTSRIHQSMDPAALDGTRYAPAYNASVPAATIAENIAFLEQYIQIDRNLKHVFFELFLYAFIGPTNEIPEKGPFDLLEDIPKLHFSTSAIRDGIATWKQNRKDGPAPAQVAPGGYLLQGARFEPSMYFVAHNFSQFVLGETKRVGGLRLYESTLNALKRAQELCDQRGIELTFVIAPSYPWDDYRLYSTGDWNLVRGLYAHVATLPRVYAFAQFNDLTGEPVSPSMRYWYDPLHFSLAMGELMQRSLAGAAVDAPSDFVLTITPDTVERALAVRFAGLQNWIARNQDFARIFDVTWSAVQRNGEANGEIDIEASELIVDGVRHPIVADKSGVVETVVRNRDHMVISGWAADTVNRIPTANLVATVGKKVVSKWFPGTPRLDNEAVYGRNIRPSNFVMRVNGAPPAPEIIRVFALMEDGRAVQLSSTNPLVAGPALLAAAGQ